MPRVERRFKWWGGVGRKEMVGEEGNAVMTGIEEANSKGGVRCDMGEGGKKSWRPLG